MVYFFYHFGDSKIVISEIKFVGYDTNIMEKSYH